MGKKRNYARLFVDVGMDEDLNKKLATYLGEYVSECETARIPCTDGTHSLWEIPEELRSSVIQGLRGDNVRFYHMLKDGRLRLWNPWSNPDSDYVSSRRLRAPTIQELRKEIEAVPR